MRDRCIAETRTAGNRCKNRAVGTRHLCRFHDPHRGGVMLVGGPVDGACVFHAQPDRGFEVKWRNVLYDYSFGEDGDLYFTGEMRIPDEAFAELPPTPAEVCRGGALTADTPSAWFKLDGIPTPVKLDHKDTEARIEREGENDER